MAGETNVISQNWGEFGDGATISLSIVTSEPLTLADWRRLTDAMRAIDHFLKEFGAPQEQEPF